jgi:molybdopterin-guanine dinucleotide biosynthesis protein A
LGRDKCRIKIGDEDLVARTVRLLKYLCSDIWLLGRDASEHGLDIPSCRDDFPGIGPLGGILTALKRAEGKACLVLACDLPFLDRETLTVLIRERELSGIKTAMTTFRQNETGYIESLVAVYEPAAFDLLYPGLEKGEFKLSRLIPENRRHHIPYSREKTRVFFNVNRPEDLEYL